jgi:hypothetical protein
MQVRSLLLAALAALAAADRVALPASDDIDIQDAVLEKVAKASVGSFDPAFVPGLSDSADFVTAVPIAAESHLYGGRVQALLGDLAPSLRASGFRLVFTDSGTTYLVEEPADAWASTVTRAWEMVTKGSADALHARVLRAVCAALDRDSPHC